MSERWRRELGRLDELEPPSRLVDEARERPPAPSSGPTVRSRVVAGVVAFGIFALAGSFAYQALRTGGEPPPAPAGVANALPALEISFRAGSLLDGDVRRVDTTIDYGDVHEEDFTSTTPDGAIVEWVSEDMLTPFVPGPAAGSAVSIEADGDDPRVLIGRPGAWPNFDRFERIDRLPTEPGDYVLIFAADYAEGTAQTARRIHVVEPGAVQLVLTEGGKIDAATATAYADGAATDGFLSSSSFAHSDVSLGTADIEPDFTSSPPLRVTEGARILLATEADGATAGFVATFEDAPKVLPTDVTSGSATVTAPPGSWLLAVDATWARGVVSWTTDGTREEARFFFPVEVIGGPTQDPSPAGEEPSSSAPTPTETGSTTTSAAPPPGTPPDVLPDIVVSATAGDEPVVDAVLEFSGDPVPLISGDPADAEATGRFAVPTGTQVRFEGDATDVAIGWGEGSDHVYDRAVPLAEQPPVTVHGPQDDAPILRLRFTWPDGSSAEVSIAFLVGVPPLDSLELACSPDRRVDFAPAPDALLLGPGSDLAIRANVPGVVASDAVAQITWTDGEDRWNGTWAIYREGALVALLDYETLTGTACHASGIG